MDCNNIWYVYRFLISQIYVKGYFVANENEKCWGELKIDALNGGGGYKREMIILFYGRTKR